MITDCVNCGKEFHCKTKKAMYCSPACKMKIQRARAAQQSESESRMIDIFDQKDLQLIKTVSPDSEKNIRRLWAIHGKVLGRQVLETVWSLMLDANLIPEDYKS